MSTGRYAFLPWMRCGIANEITVPATTTNRAKLTVTLSVTGAATPQPVQKPIELTGPGDILGINPQQIIRMQPRPWITDFEPNYLVFVEFFDEDFPWRYTPAMVDAANHRLAPWLTLFVLKESEFDRNRKPGRPLLSIRIHGDVDFNTIVPPDDQLHAWSHAQITDTIGTGTAPDLAKLDAVLKASPERGISRLMSPRRLLPNTAYFAFVVPTYEIGRRAGLGETIAPTLSGLQIARPTAREYPVYHEWYFRTGEAGDFEELVRRLKPNVADARIGIRDLDIRAPGFGMGAVTNPPDGLVGLEGALVAPTATPRGLSPASDFTAKLAPIVNAPAEQVTSPVIGGDDPVVAPPLYCHWHALVERLDPSRAPVNWFARLNADPRYRAAAGMGARVVRQNQEAYMREAWRQIGEVLRANETINRTQLGMLVSEATYVKSVAGLPQVQGLAVTAPVFAKVLGSATTLRHQAEASRLTAASLSGPFRKLTHPRGMMARRAFATRSGAAPLASVVRAINEGRATAEPPKPVRTTDTWEAAAEGLTSNIPDWLKPLLRRFRLILLAAIVLIILLLALLALAGTALPVLAGLALVAGASLGALAWMGSRLASRLATKESLDPANITPSAVRDAPGPADFALREPGETSPPAGVASDAATATNFRTALGEFAQVFATVPVNPPPRAALDLATAHRKVMEAINPLAAQPRRLMSRLRLGGRSLADHIGRYFDADPQQSLKRVVKCLAYPDIKDAMYKPLADLGTRLLVPNIDLIPQNSLSLLIVNERFIEAYLAGVNVEFCSELLWREYPTDQRGSSFRQFWDVSAVMTPPGIAPENRDEALKDIEKIHEWTIDPVPSKLGKNRKQTPGRAAASLVLVVRGDLLKRYPNTIIYAQRAQWSTDPRRQNELVLIDESGAITSADPANPDVRFPLFKAQVEPDIHFIGFNLTPLEVRGAEGLEETAQARTTIPANQLGWFFVLQEMVGEPRFGLDETSATPPQTNKWDNLSWQNLGEVALIDFNRPFAQPMPGTAAPNDPAWGANAADVAAILYQKPVLVAVHGRELIKDLPPGGSPWTD